MFFRITFVFMYVLTASRVKSTVSGYGFPSWLKPEDLKFVKISTPTDNVVVAKDGSGSFTTIKEAIDAAPSGNGRYQIYVKQGVYEEYLEIQRENITLRGDGRGKTIITGNKSAGAVLHTLNTATVGVTGDGFIARDITFRNTAGPIAQAVALRSESDRSVFYQCSIEGYQDTLYVHSHRQFYRDCDIFGTVDFIFGDATAVVQNCNIFVRLSPSRIQTITAQSRAHFNDTTGIVIHDSRVTAASDLLPVLGSTRTYLGRPWNNYSRTVFMKTFLDRLIDPSGWYEWEGRLQTSFYAEFQNTGPGASTSGRVQSPGFRVLPSASEALPFTVATFINGSSWIPSSVPFNPGL